MLWHKAINPFPSPGMTTPVPPPGPDMPRSPVRPSATRESTETTPEWEKNLIITKLLKQFNTMSHGELRSLLDKMVAPQQPKPSPVPAQVPQTRNVPSATTPEASPGPFDRTTPKIRDLRERMKGMNIQPAQTPTGMQALTPAEKATLGRPPGMQQFLRQRQQGN